jgi:hypothetical protein
MRRPRKRRLPLYWIFGVLVAGLLVTAFLALRPSNLEAIVRRALDASFTVPVRHDRIEVGWTGSVEIRGLSVGPDTDAPLMTAERVRVHPDLLGALWGGAVVRAITIENGAVRVSRDASGAWSTAGILKKRDPKASGALPSFDLRGLRVQITDAFGRDDPVTLEVADVAATLGTTVESADRQRVSIEARGSIVDEAGFGARWSGEIAANGSFEGRAELRLTGLELESPTLETWIAPYVPEWIERRSSLALRGAIDATVDLSLRGTVSDAVRASDSGGLGSAPMSEAVVDASQVEFDVSRIAIGVDVSRISLDSPLGPRSVHGGHASLRWLGSAIEIDVEAKVRDAALAGKGTLNFDEATKRISSWQGSMVLTGLTIDDELVRASRPELAATVEHLGLRGVVDVDVGFSPQVSWPPPQGSWSARCTFRDATIAYEGFPYPIHSPEFVCIIEGNLVRIDSTPIFRAGSGTARVDRMLTELSAGGLLDIDLDVRDLDLDDRLQRACPKNVRWLWDELAPRGRGNARVIVSRAPAPVGAAAESSHASPRIRVEISPQRAGILYRRFPYDIRDITGSVIVDTGTHEVTFPGLSGVHGGAQVSATGRIDLAGGTSVLDFECPELEIDEDLIAATPEHYRAMIEDFALRGRVFASTRMTSSVDGVVLDIRAKVIDARVRHRSFPYEVPISQGELRTDGSTRIEISGLRTPESFTPRLEFVGRLGLTPENSGLRFESSIGEFTIDERFIEALPPTLKDFVTTTGLAGTFGGKLDGELAFDVDGSEQHVFSYRLYDLIVSQAAFRFGPQIRDAHAVGEIRGKSGPDDRHTVEGDLFLQDARFNRLGLEGGTVQLRFGTPHPLVVGGPRRPSALPPESYQIDRELRDRLAKSDDSKRLTLSVTSESFYGGQVNGFLFVDVGPRQEFAAHFVASDVQVARAAVDVFSYKEGGASGRAEGSVLFWGKTNDQEGFEGKGRGIVTDANLARVPLFYSVLDLLNLSKKSGVFRRLELPFEIHDEKFHSDAIDIDSSLISLSGSGTLDFEGNLDLRLSPEFLPIEVPILGDILGFVKRAIWDIEVRGPLSSPDVDMRVAVAKFPLGSGSAPEKEKEEEKVKEKENQ